MSALPERTRTIAALKVLSEIVGKQTIADKDALMSALRDLGVKGSVDAVMPDGTPIGTVTMNKGRTVAAVNDRAAFTAWVAKNHPQQVSEVTTTVVRPAFEMAVLKSAQKAGEPVDVKTGEAIPGVGVIVGEPFLTTRLADEAHDVVLTAMRTGFQPLALPGGAE